MTEKQKYLRTNTHFHAFLGWPEKERPCKNKKVHIVRKTERQTDKQTNIKDTFLYSIFRLA
jgi:hypothetical protein